MTPHTAWRRALILGGARSGKSAFAERMAIELGGEVLYVAVAQPLDEEMADRIRRHRERRPEHWRTLEEPRRVAQAARADLGGANVVVVEDLTLLLSNLFPDATAWEESSVVDTGTAEADALEQVAGCFALPVHVILVSNDVGMGLVPPYPLGRAFRDAMGRLNQAAAARADEVHFVVAGVALRIKPPG